MNMKKTNRPTPRSLDASGLTDRGRVRARNEDQFVLGDLGRSMLVQSSSLDIADASRVPAPLKAHLMLVADGMGGQPGGERASTVAAGEASRYVLESMPFRDGAASNDEVHDELGSLVRHCDGAVRALRSDDDERAPGTTLTLAYLRGTQLHVAHVGDSRCYVLRDGRLEQVTTDHTLSQRMIDRGAVHPEDVTGLGYDSVLWNSIGGSPDEVDPEIHTVDAVAADAVLLCTDGLTRHVPDEDITAILRRSTSADQACRTLVDEAKSRGGSDNVTVVVAYLTARTAPAGSVPAADAARRSASRVFGSPQVVEHLRPDRQSPALPAVPIVPSERRRLVRGRRELRAETARCSA